MKPALTIPRLATAAATERLAGSPMPTITGPRQSGKTTLARMLRPELPYFQLGRSRPNSAKFSAIIQCH
jgi:predicted AAA+ superfamily ATPase